MLCTVAAAFLALCVSDLSVARLCLEPTLLATELATEFRGPRAQGSHLLLFASVHTFLYCIPCSVLTQCRSLGFF